MLKVLSTKKLKHSLLAEAEENGIRIVEKEFIEVSAIATSEKAAEVRSAARSGILHAAFTSANAVEAVKNLLGAEGARWRLCCLEGKTREALIHAAASLGHIVVTGKDSKELAGEIIKTGVKELLFFCGNKRRDELPAALAGAGIRVQEIIVYETAEKASAAKDEWDAILFFSPSAVQSFFSVNELKKGTACFAIGETTAAAIRNFSSPVHISKTASQEAMLDALLHWTRNR
ncbi:MAG TPA: uroporphyrinogen-III synthase [Flavisolibacter sp.]|nr:uroporphyrinogen-III synthase [Flavisolibacter sp.]